MAGPGRASDAAQALVQPAVGQQVFEDGICQVPSWRLDVVVHPSTLLDHMV